MQDRPIFDRINALSGEEERLYELAAGQGGLSSEQQARIAAIRVEIDQAYDLLHQRQARRAAGLDPDEAELRSPDVVEEYDQ
jgi:hypothetical protein